MQKTLLSFFILLSYLGFSQNPNLVYNGNVELFSSPTSSPSGWSSSSDFGGFNQNTTDFSEGASSVQFNPMFTDLMMFTTVAIPLEANKTYNIKYSYKFLGNAFDTDDNIKFQIYLTSTEKFENFVSITNNDWNTVEVQYTPTVSDADAEASITVTPGDSEYAVLFDDIQIVEAAALSNTDVSKEKHINLVPLGNNQYQIKTGADTQISNVSLYSILGAKQRLSPASKRDQNYNLNHLSAGLYVFHITTNTQQVAEKILIK